MTEYEKWKKVIKGLECCAAMSGDECKECPYSKECLDADLPYGMPHLAADSLALLKEQEPVSVQKKQMKMVGFQTWDWACGNCGQTVLFSAKYCPWCGKAVKW